MNIQTKTRQPKRKPDRRKLTPLLIDKVKPGEDRERIWDTDVSGLVLQVEPSGSKSFYACYRRNGRPRWYRLGAANRLGLSSARDVVRHLNARLVLDPAYDPQAEKVANRTQGTVDDLVERYIAGHLVNLKSGSQGTFLLRRYVSSTIGKMAAADVQRSDIRTLLGGISSASLRQQVLANVGGLFSWAIRNDYLAVAANPAKGIEQRKATARERVLSASELPVFWHGFDADGLTAGRALRIILLTGQRPGEVRHMRWQDLEIGDHQITDDNGRTYTVYGAWWTLQGQPSDDGTWPGTKNGNTHRVWLSKPALRIVEEIRDELPTNNQSPFVFAGRNRRPIKLLDASMRRVCQALEIVKPDKVTPHDLRRSHGTMTTSLGFSRDQMNRLQNHKEGGVGSVYDRHSYSHEARLIQEAVAGRLMSLVDGQPNDNVISMGR
jgi:integrase